MSEPETKPKVKGGKVIEGVVQACPFCKMEFDEADNTNTHIICGGCEKEFKIIQI